MLESHVALPSDHPAPAWVDSARVADELGLEGIWLTDVRFTRDCFVLLGAAAMMTRHVALAVGVNDPFSRHPAALAAAYATVAELAPRRVIIGLGAGGSGLDRIGVRRERPAHTVAEAIRVLRALADGQTVSAETPGFTLREGRLPWVSRPVPLIAMAAHGPGMYALAGRAADIVLVANYARDAGLDWAEAQLAPGLAERSPRLKPLRRLWRIDIAVSDDGDQARAVLRQRVRQLLVSGYYSAAFLAPVGLESDAGPHPDEQAVNRVTDAIAFAGTPEDVVERMTALLARHPFDGVCWRPYAAGKQSFTDAVRIGAEVVSTAIATSGPAASVT